MRKLRPWVSHVGYAAAAVLLAWQLYRAACTSGQFTLVSFAEVLVMAFCLTKLSYLVFPRGWLKQRLKGTK